MRHWAMFRGVTLPQAQRIEEKALIEFLREMREAGLTVTQSIVQHQACSTTRCMCVTTQNLYRPMFTYKIYNYIYNYHVYAAIDNLKPPNTKPGWRCCGLHVAVRGRSVSGGRIEML